jgi:hypothetical protein
MKFKPTIPASRKVKTQADSLVESIAEASERQRSGRGGRQPRPSRPKKQQPVEVAGIFSQGLAAASAATSASAIKPTGRGDFVTSSLGTLKYDISGSAPLPLQFSDGAPGKKMDTSLPVGMVSDDEDVADQNAMDEDHPMMPISVVPSARLSDFLRESSKSDDSHLIGQFLLNSIGSATKLLQGSSKIGGDKMDIDGSDKYSNKPFIVQLPPIFPPLDGTSGVMGELVVRKSGGTELHLIGSGHQSDTLRFHVDSGAACSFHQQLALVENTDGGDGEGRLPTFNDLGAVDTIKFVVTPDLNALLASIGTSEMPEN